MCTLKECKWMAREEQRKEEAIILGRVGMRPPLSAVIYVVVSVIIGQTREGQQYIVCMSVCIIYVCMYVCMYYVCMYYVCMYMWKTKHVVMSRCQNVGQNHNLLIDKKFSKCFKVQMFRENSKSQNCFHGEIKSRFYSRDVCCQILLSLLSTRLLSKN